MTDTILLLAIMWALCTNIVCVAYAVPRSLGVYQANQRETESC
jgi:hypothetical protein